MVDVRGSRGTPQSKQERISTGFGPTRHQKLDIATFLEWVTEMALRSKQFPDIKNNNSGNWQSRWSVRRAPNDNRGLSDENMFNFRGVLSRGNRRSSFSNNINGKAKTLDFRRRQGCMGWERPTPRVKNKSTNNNYSEIEHTSKTEGTEPNESIWE